MGEQFIEWNDSFLVGIDVIDTQHKEIWRILNLTYDAHSLDYSTKGLKLIIELLIEYALTHFETEERFMQSSRYVDMTEHVHEHQKFWIDLKPLTAKAIENKDLTNLEVITFIKTWIMDHVMVTDMKLK